MKGRCRVPCAILAISALVSAIVFLTMTTHGALKERPRLSVVVTLRNDNYGAKTFYRFSHFVRHLDHQSKRTGIKMELVIVEWNPPKENKPIAEELALSDLEHITYVNVITVSEEHHKQFVNAKRRDMYEFIAKNVGVRRAQGEWVLTTNGDDILSDAAWDFLATSSLDPTSYYRIGLQNTGHPAPANVDFSKLSSILKQDVTDIHGTHASLNIQSTWSELEKAMQLEKFWQDEKEYLTSTGDSRGPFLDASGDFILMTKKNWETLRGFDEEAINTYMHWDSQLLAKATAHGVKERVLLPPIESYHMYHHKNQWSQKYMGVQTNMNAVQWQTEFMKTTNQACSFNGHDWGLNKVAFAETHYVHGKTQCFWTRLRSRISRTLRNGFGAKKSVDMCQDLIARRSVEFQKQAQERRVSHGLNKRGYVDGANRAIAAIMDSFAVFTSDLTVDQSVICQLETQNITWQNATEPDCWLGIFQTDGAPGDMVWIDKFEISTVNDSMTYTVPDCAAQNYTIYLNSGNFTDSVGPGDTFPLAHVNMTVYVLPDCVDAPNPGICPAWEPPVEPTVAPTNAPPVAVPSTQAPTEAPTSSGLSAGAIAGIVIGTLVALVIVVGIAIAVYYFVIRRASYDRVA